MAAVGQGCGTGRPNRELTALGDGSYPNKVQALAEDPIEGLRARRATQAGQPEPILDRP